MEILIIETTDKKTRVITEGKEIEQFKSSLPCNNSDKKIFLDGKWLCMCNVVTFVIRKVNENKSKKLGRPFNFD